MRNKHYIMYNHTYQHVMHITELTEYPFADIDNVNYNKEGSRSAEAGYGGIAQR